MSKFSTHNFINDASKRNYMYKKKKLAKKKHRKNKERLKALKVVSLSKAKPKKKIVPPSIHMYVSGDL